MQVRERDGVVVDDAERPDPGIGQILQHRRTQAAGADHQRAGGLQLTLRGPANAPEHDLARVALDFFNGEGHGPVGLGARAVLFAIESFQAFRRLFFVTFSLSYFTA